jgi:hypothetical protein
VADVPPVNVVDRVLLPASEVPGWLERLHTEYADGAQQRGMRLADSWWSYDGPDAIEVTIRWELPDVTSFWAMRHAAGSDKSLTEWWVATDAVALRRHRTVCAQT